ncbi:AI-2E family transporter [Robertkochia aurantiaca]|uniref:AI-2E family transporter n=1 Tax=Robertkochia aurantiaca TaxID=2873700 RepID=UPI001CC9D9A8|nr:AI-2E family transporter [Robertkochia sp. 3YJGBD-33]
MTNRDNHQDDLRFRRRIVSATIIVLLLTGLALLTIKSIKLLLMILAGVLVAIFFSSLARKIRSLLPVNRGVSLLIGVFLLLLIGTITIIAAGPSISRQAETIRKELPRAFEDFKETAKETPVLSYIYQRVKRSFSEDSKDTKALEKFFSSFLGGLSDLYIILFLGIFFMVSPGIYEEGMVRLCPPSGRERCREVLHTLRFTLQHWLAGKLLSMLVVAVLTAIGLYIMGIPMALILAISAGLLAFIPNFGPLIALIPAFLIAYSKSPDSGLYVILLYIGVQAVESNLITPFIQRNMISFPFALILIAQVIMGIFTGYLGLILAVPMVAVVVVLVKMLYIEDILNDTDIQVKGEPGD